MENLKEKVKSYLFIYSREILSGSSIQANGSLKKTNYRMPTDNAFVPSKGTNRSSR